MIEDVINEEKEKFEVKWAFSPKLNKSDAPEIYSYSLFKQSDIDIVERLFEILKLKTNHFSKKLSIEEYDIKFGDYVIYPTDISKCE